MTTTIHDEGLARDDLRTRDEEQNGIGHCFGFRCHPKWRIAFIVQFCRRVIDQKIDMSPPEADPVTIATLPTRFFMM